MEPLYGSQAHTDLLLETLLPPGHLFLGMDVLLLTKDVSQMLLSLLEKFSAFWAIIILLLKSFQPSEHHLQGFIVGALVLVLCTECPYFSPIHTSYLLPYYTGQGPLHDFLVGQGTNRSFG